MSGAPKPELRVGTPSRAQGWGGQRGLRQC